MLLRAAAERGAELVVYPELALTTFFPRYWYEDGDPALDAWYETELPGPDTKPLFDEAVRLGVGFELGFAELTPDGRRFNTAVLVGPDGTEAGRYRKIHLPGHGEHEPWRPFQHLEKRYFEVGDLGFPTFDSRFGGQGRDADLQRPAMAGGLPRARAAGRRAHLRRVQHAGPQPAGARARPVRRLPQPPRHASRRLPERSFVVGVAKAGREEGIDHIGGSA